MKVTIEVDLKPFTVPNYVLVKSAPGLRQDGMQEDKKYELKDLDEFTLHQLCEEFANDVFKKAGKKRPIDLRK